MSDKKKSKKKGSAVAKTGSTRLSRIEKKARVSKIITAAKKLRFDVEVSISQPITKDGVMAEKHANSLVLKCRPKSGSKKEGYLVIQNSDLLSLEGSLGEYTRAIFMDSVTEKYKNVAVKHLDNGDMVLKTEDGDLIQIFTSHENVKALAVAAELEGKADKKKKKKKRKEEDDDEDFDE